MESLGNWQTLWAWIVGHRFEMLSVLYLASVFCSVLLAGCVYSLGRRQARLAQCYRAKIAATEKQMGRVDERLTTLASSITQMATLEGQLRAADERLTALASLLESTARSRLVPAVGQPWAAAPAAAIREEMTRLLQELQQDECPERAEAPEPLQALTAE